MSLGSFVAAIPQRMHLPDETLAWKLQGYAYVGDRCRELGTDVFETRLLLQRTICMLGAEAARVFYDTTRLQREGAAPLRVQATLFGRGGVQSLDGDAHHARKQLFLALMTPESIRRLCELVDAAWQAAAVQWRREIVLFDEAQEVLCRAVCAWAGVTLDDARRVRDLSAMIDGAGGVGPRFWRGLVGRARAEWWIEKQIMQVRAGTLPAVGALGVFAKAELEPKIASVELLNVIRPTVAIARYVAFAALALHEYPRARELAQQEALVHEVRRFYPFFPAVVARVRRAFSWHGVDFGEGERVMLDLYGTNHDPRSWSEPDEFRPERFLGWHGDPYALIPQGGGDVAAGHRCPGEGITIEVLKTSLRFLTRAITYDVPEQDLSVSLARVPALPASGFVIANAKPR